VLLFLVVAVVAGATGTVLAAKSPLLKSLLPVRWRAWKVPVVAGDLGRLVRMRWLLVAAVVTARLGRMPRLLLDAAAVTARLGRLPRSPVAATASTKQKIFTN
jgi:hypothetical protein